MRVISGSARRTNLKTVPGESTRPTTDRIKETLFNMIQGELYDCLFLDLFSGSGAIGIEALSRGARRCYFVEQAKEAVACIRQNLDATHLGQKAVVMDCDVLAAIGRLKGKEKPFDFTGVPFTIIAYSSSVSTLRSSSVPSLGTIAWTESIKQRFG